MYHKSHEYLMPVSPIAGATRRHGRWMILSSCLCFVFLGGGKSREKAEKKRMWNGASHESCGRMNRSNRGLLLLWFVKIE
jgi:hypothetical protein